MSIERNFAVGIDLGTMATKACIAQIPRPGQPPGPSKIVLNDVTNRETPTIVAYDTDHRLIGEPGKSAIVSNGKNACALFPLALAGLEGEAANVLTERFNTHECAITVADGDCLYKPTNKAEGVSVAQVAVAYLSRIATFARADIKGIHEAAVLKHIVVVVPDSPSQAQQANLGKALQALDVEWTIVESCHVIAHSYQTKHRPDDARLVMFMDVGKSTTETSLVQFHGKGGKEGKPFTVVAKAAAPQLLGARDFVDVIAEIVLGTLKEKHNCIVGPASKDYTRLQNACNKALEVLSANKATVVTLESFAGDRDFRIDVSREDFEAECRKRNIPEKLTKMLTDCQASNKCDDIYALEIVGGGSRIPLVKEILQAHIGGGKVGQTLDGSMASAQGAVELFTVGGLVHPCPVVLSEAQMNEARALAEREAKDESRDAAFRALAERKNDIESRIYKYRDILTSNDASLFDTKDTLTDGLQAKEDWLFDNWDCLTLETMDRATDELEALWQTGTPRYAAHMEAMAARQKEEETKRVAERLAEESEKGPQDYDTRKLKKPERMKKVGRNKEEGNELLKGGQYKLAIGHYDKALAHCDKFFDLSPADEDEVKAVRMGLHNNISQAYLKLKEWKKAVSAADKVLDINPEHVKARYRKALGLEGAHDYKAALAVLAKALEASPTDPERKALDSLVLRVTDSKQKEDERSKKVFSKMFG